MDKPFSLPVTLDSVRRLKDRSVALRFTSMLEVPNGAYHAITDRELDDGWMLFSSNPISESEIPKEPAQGDKKSQATRIRNKLYVWWKQKYEKEMTSDEFYNIQTEKYLDWIGEHLEPLDDTR